MSRRARWALFVGAALLALLSTWPLPVAVALLGASPLAATEADGTVWRGRLREARWGRHRLGTLSLRLSLWRLALGEARIEANGPRLAAAWVQGRRHGLEGVRGTLDAGPAGFPLRLRFEDVGALFDSRGCRLAAGTVAIELAALQAAGEPAPVLSAVPRCEDGRWRAAFSGEAPPPMSRLGGELSLDADGAYRFRAEVGGADPTLRLALAAHGFVADGDGLSLTVDGRAW